jgi:hypothetical protein
MCRSIKTLFNFEPPATDEEVRAAALQFVRKLSGFNSPSQANRAAFDRAVDEVTASARGLIAALVTTADPRDREIEGAARPCALGGALRRTPVKGPGRIDVTPASPRALRSPGFQSANDWMRPMTPRCQGGGPTRYHGRRPSPFREPSP